MAKFHDYKLVHKLPQGFKIIEDTDGFALFNGDSEGFEALYWGCKDIETMFLIYAEILKTFMYGSNKNFDAEITKRIINKIDPHF